MFTSSHANGHVASLLIAGLATAAVAACGSSGSGGGTVPTTSHGPTSVSHSASTAPAGVPVPPNIKVSRTLSVPATWLRYGLDSVWDVTNGGALLRLTVSGKTTAHLLRSGALDVKFEGDHMYVLTDSGVEELDPSTGHVLHSHAIVNAISFAVRGGVAYVESSIVGGAAIESVDVATGRGHTVRLPYQPSNVEHDDGVAADANGALWVIDGNYLLEVRASTLKVENRYELPFDGTTLLSTPAGVFVATQNSGGGVARLAPGAKSVSTCWQMGDALQLATDGTDVWDSAAAGLTKLNERTCAVLGQATPLDGGGTGVLVLPSEVWITFPDFNKIQVVARG